MEIKAFMNKDRYLEFIEFIDGKYSTNDEIQIFLERFIRQDESKRDLKELLHLISSISYNHLQTSDLYNKIKQTLLYLKDSINKFFSNFDVFNLFKHNKAILSFLIENKMLTIDKYITKKFLNDKYIKAKYLQYFSDEIKIFLPKNVNEQLMEEIHRTKTQEDDQNTLKKIIQEDSIEQFKSYIKENKLSLLTLLKPSVSQSSLFINSRKVTLIEYAAFYGSFQIFNYLFEQRVKVASEIWLYAIHGNNLKIIETLEKQEILPISYKDCFIESIKCHHNEIAFHIQEKYLSKEANDDIDVFTKSLKYHNYLFISNNIDIKTAFYYFCKYDYSDLVENILKTQNVDINEKMI